MADINSVDLSTYTLIAKYDLPEPTRTAAPANSVLAQESSAVTYNGNTDTLFVVGDGGTSIVQVTKTGQLIDSMTLAPGEFVDPEGLTYVGGGKFVLVEERVRQANLFTYVPNTTLTKSNVQTVKLGTTIGNIGIEGISYDPSTGGFIAVKEAQLEGIFQTGIDFAVGTATNGSPTTENSTNLFDPALANLSDFADVYALSNLSSLNGQADYGHLLVLSQESGKVIEIDRNGTIYSTLTISDPTNPLTVPAQGHEGLTMDKNGVLYIVSEEGGGDINHPQLWVYAPSSVPNQAPTALTLNNQVNTIAENTSTASRIKVADIAIADDGLGTNTLAVTGADASFFEVDSSGLYIKANTSLDYEAKTGYSVSVTVDDTTAGATPDAIATFNLAVTDVVNETPALPAVIISEVAPWSSGNSPVGADWFEVTNTTASAINITGWKVDDSSGLFASAATLNGITSIAPGESVIFLETANLASVGTTFRNTWFGANPPAGLQVGSYSGSGLGLSTGGDAVNLYNSGGVLQASVSFGPSPAGPAFPTFNNAAGLNNAAILQLSAVGVSGGFAAVNDANETGSPGAIANPVPVNQAPIANNDSGFTANQSEAKQIAIAALLANDTDPDVGTTLSIVPDGFSAALGGSVALTGNNVVFTPNASFSGTASFQYTVTDGNLTSQAIVSVEVGKTIAGGNGKDTIPGTAGDDNLTGGNGKETLFGYAGNDRLSGGNGVDTLWGGEGDDLLTGGNGRDTFVLTGSGNGTDTVQDFNLGQDWIGLSGGLSFGQLTIADVNGSAAIRLGDETLALLTGVTPNQLGASSFVTV